MSVKLRLPDENDSNLDHKDAEQEAAELNEDDDEFELRGPDVFARPYNFPN